MTERSILITGATGFVGGAVRVRALKTGAAVRTIGRSPLQFGDEAKNDHRIGDLGEWSGSRSLVDGMHAVIHCAGRAHIMNDMSADPLAEFRRINVEATLNLARSAAEAGVRRFVFISSVKVNGESTEPGRAYDESSELMPVDPYGISKCEAEQGLLTIARETAMEVVIIRPPLVYGPGVKGNFAAMMHWVKRGVPLPLGAVRSNRRSFVALDNLVDLIVTCVDHPAAANEVFLAGDGEDLSTAELLERLAAAMGRKARLFAVPVWMLEQGAALLGKRDEARRLLGSLQVDIGKARLLLGWEPPISVDEGLRRAAGPVVEGA